MGDKLISETMSSFKAVSRSGASKLFILIQTSLLVILVSFVIILTSPVYLFRRIVIHLANIFRPDLGSILNGQSSLFANELFSSRPLRGNIVVSITARGVFTLEEINKLVTKNWLKRVDPVSGKLKYPQFQQFAVRWCGFTFYKNASDTFDLRNHVHFHPNLGNEPVTDKDLNSFSEKLLNSPFKANTSPWEIHLVHNYLNPTLCSDLEMSLLVIRMHHSFADGFSIVASIMEGLFEYSLSNLKMPTAKPVKRTVWQDTRYRVTAPLESMVELVDVVSHNFHSNPWKVPDESKEWYQFYEKSELVPVEHVTKIKNTFGVTFSSVLISAISSGVHRHFKRMKIGYKGDMFFLSTLPAPGHSMLLTNHSAAAVFDIPTVINGSSLDRLQNCYRRLESKRSSVLPHFGKALTDLLGCHFSSFGAAVSKNKSIVAGLTNFPLFPVQIKANGKLGLGVDFIVGGMEGTCGVVITVMSYYKHLRVCASAEKAIMSKEELKNFLADVVDEIRLLHKLANKQDNANAVSNL